MKTVFFSPPALHEDDIEAVISVLRSGWITTGSINEEFRLLLQQYTNAKYTTLVNSATSGLFIALKAMGIGEGDEVITTPYTFAATTNVIYHTGAKIIFADVKKDSFYLDMEDVYSKITPKTKAIIPVEYCTANDYNIDLSLISKHFIPNNKYQECLQRPMILLDGAHSLGSSFVNPNMDMVAYSFHAVKNLTTAEGGALSMRSFGDDELDRSFARDLQLLTLHGQNKSAKDKFLSGSWEYDIEIAGYKCNMPDTLAALGLSQLKRYDDILSHRRQLTKKYKALLTPESQVLMQEKSIFQDIDSSSCHLFPIRIDQYTAEQRNQLISYCLNKGVHMNVHYKPLQMMSVSAYYDTNSDLPNSYAQYQNQISLPLHSGMNMEDVEYVVEVLKKGLSL